jgi:hypothetical protein
MLAETPSEIFLMALRHAIDLIKIGKNAEAETALTLLLAESVAAKNEANEAECVFFLGKIYFETMPGHTMRFFER